MSSRVHGSCAKREAPSSHASTRAFLHNGPHLKSHVRPLTTNTHLIIDIPLATSVVDSLAMSDQPSMSGAQAAANEPPLSALSTSTLGSAPKRVRHREEQIESAYELQRNAALKGAILYTALGASTCFMAHHLFPGFRRQTLALKGFLTSGATIFGFVVGADTVLLSHESQQRSEENMVRSRARAELGKKGIVASEKEIEKWKDEYIQQKLEERRLRREQLLRELEQSESTAPSPGSASPASTSS